MRASFFPNSEVPKELQDQIQMSRDFQKLVEYQEKGFLDMEMQGRRPKTSLHPSGADRSGSRFSSGSPSSVHKRRGSNNNNDMILFKDGMSPV